MSTGWFVVSLLTFRPGCPGVEEDSLPLTVCGLVRSQDARIDGVMALLLFEHLSVPEADAGGAVVEDGVYFCVGFRERRIPEGSGIHSVEIERPE
jgi:hypothetical protein